MQQPVITLPKHTNHLFQLVNANTMQDLAFFNLSGVECGWRISCQLLFYHYIILRNNNYYSLSSVFKVMLTLRSVLDFHCVSFKWWSVKTMPWRRGGNVAADGETPSPHSATRLLGLWRHGETCPRVARTKDCRPLPLLSTSRTHASFVYLS